MAAKESSNIQGGTPSQSPVSPGSTVIGRLIADDFEIRRKIGQGGMGTVYEAWQRSLRRPVAIKILASSLGAGGNMVERFQREAQAAAKLHHPNIVPIYARGEHEGLYFYVMELISGRGLNDIIAERRGGQPDATSQGSALELTETKFVSGGGSPSGGGADPAATARMKTRVETVRSATSTSQSSAMAEQFMDMARLLASAADAIDYAHKNGVIHRDIKPHNFLYGNDGRLSITDFGLARMLEQPGMTMTGEFVGSPLYMSPEQISGAQGRLDHRTDIYSLGATMYEWLTLRPPFPGETREQVISQILMSEPVPPRSLDQSIPQDLETICLKALSKSPGRRYSTAGEMCDDLRRYLGHESIRARREGWIARARKYIVRHKAAAVIVGGLVATVSIGWAFQSRRELHRKEEQIAAVAQDAQDKDSRIRELEAEQELLRLKLGNLPFESKVGEIALDVFSGMASGASGAFSAIADTAPSAPVPPSIAPSAPGSAMEAVIQTQQDLQLLGSFADDLTASLRKARADQPSSRAPDDLRFRAADEYFREALESKDPSAAMTLTNMALSNAFDHFDSLYLRCLLDLKLGNIEDAIGDAHALIESESHPGPAYLLRGLSRVVSGAHAEGIEDLNRAVEKEPRLPAVWAARGAARSRLGKFLEALDDLDRALLLSPNHSIVLREREQTLDRVRFALDTLTGKLTADPENYDFLVLRGDMHDILGDYGAAMADYEKAFSAVKVKPAALLTKMIGMQKKLRESSNRSSQLDERSGSRPRTDATVLPIHLRCASPAAALVRAVSP